MNSMLPRKTRYAKDEGNRGAKVNNRQSRLTGPESTISGQIQIFRQLGANGAAQWESTRRPTKFGQLSHLS